MFVCFQFFLYEKFTEWCDVSLLVNGDVFHDVRRLVRGNVRYWWDWEGNGNKTWLCLRARTGTGLNH